MSYHQSTIGRINIYDGAAIDIQRKDDLLKPSLYLVIYAVDGYSDESGGQIGEKPLELGGFPS